MKLVFTLSLLAVCVMSLAAESFYSTPGEMQKIWQSSRNFFRRDAARNAELQQLNPEWKLEKIWPSYGVRDIYASACDDNGNIFFLTGDTFDFQIFQISDSGKAALRWSFPRMRRVSPTIGHFMTMKVDNDTLLLTEGRHVWISQPQKKLLYRISHFPFMVQSAWLQGDRLMLLGEKQLMSCDRSGKDRCTHFAANQAGKALGLLQKYPQIKFFAGGTGDNPDEAILFYGETPSAFGKYSLSKNTFTEILPLPEPNSQQSIFHISKNRGNFLYSWAANPLYGAISLQFVYHISTGEVTVIGNSINDHLKKIWQNRPADRGLSWNKQHFITGPIAYNGKYLLYSGGHIPMQMRDHAPACAGIIDLTKYPDGAVLKYPAVNGLYFSKDERSLIAVEYYQVTRITPVNPPQN